MNWITLLELVIKHERVIEETEEYNQFGIGRY
jgi:hypothetical protein